MGDNMKYSAVKCKPGTGKLRYTRVTGYELQQVTPSLDYCYLITSLSDIKCIFNNYVKLRPKSLFQINLSGSSIEIILVSRSHSF